MIKKIFALAALALVSMNASAGYVRYEFKGDFSGQLIQNDVDKSIMDYSLTAKGLANFSSDVQGVSDQRSSFWGEYGPTNFSSFNTGWGDFYAGITVYFDGMYSDTPYAFSAYYSLTQGPGYPSGPSVAPFPTKQGWLHGYVVETAVSPELAAYYDQYGYGNLAHEVPVQNVPEPASLALLGVGALGIAALRRRKSSR